MVPRGTPCPMVSCSTPCPPMVLSQKKFCVFYGAKRKNIVFSGEWSEPENFLVFLYRNSEKKFPSFPASESSRKLFWLFYIEIRKKSFFPFISGERSELENFWLFLTVQSNVQSDLTVLTVRTVRRQKRTIWRFLGRTVTSDCTRTVTSDCTKKW